MRISLRSTLVLSALSVLALSACAPHAEPAPAAPEGAILENTTTTTSADGQPVTTYVYRLPDQLLTNGPQCTKGDPQCP
jgi:hypothetical protein